MLVIVLFLFANSSLGVIQVWAEAVSSEGITEKHVQTDQSFNSKVQKGDEEFSYEQSGESSSIQSQDNRLSDNPCITNESSNSAFSDSTNISDVNHSTLGIDENNEEEHTLWWGTSSWTFDEELGELRIEPGKLEEFDKSPWNRKDENKIDEKKIKTIIFTGTTIAPENSRLLFGSLVGRGLTNLEEIKGLANLDTSNVISMREMFHSANVSTLDLSNFKTSNVQDMVSMFSFMPRLIYLDLHHFKTEEVTDMKGMFYGSNSLKQLDLSSFDTHKVTNMTSMFRKMPSLTSINLSSFDTSNVTEMDMMFGESISLKELDLTNFDSSKITNMSYGMFKKLQLKRLKLGNSFKFGQQAMLGSPVSIDENFKETGNWIREDGKSKGYSPSDFMTQYGTGDLIAGTYVAEVEKVYWGTSPWTFDEETGVLTIESGKLGEARESPWNRRDNYQIVSEKIRKIIFTGKTEAPSDSSFLFAQLSGAGLNNLISIEGLEQIDLSKTKKMVEMFSNASKLISLKGIEKWNTSNVTDMHKLFYRMLNLQFLDLSEWQTGNVTNLYNTFAYTRNIESLDVHTWDTHQVKTMAGTFYSMSNLKTLDIRNWDTSNVNSMLNMFAYSVNLTSLEVGKWQTQNVLNMNGVFRGMSSLADLDISGWETSQNLTMEDMFRDISLEKLTLGSYFKFQSNASLSKPTLSSLNEDNKITGNWIKEDGTSNPYTPEDFMAYYGTGDLTAGLYVAEIAGSEAHLDINFEAVPQDSLLSINTIGKTSDIKITLSNTGELNSVAKNVRLDHFETQFDIISDKVTIKQTSVSGETIKNLISKEEFQESYSFGNIVKGETITISYEAIPWNNSNEKIHEADNIAISYLNGVDGVKQIARYTQTTRIESGNFGFVKVPKALEFNTTLLSINLNGQLIDRKEKDWTISIEDYRGTNSRFHGLEGDLGPDRQNWELTATSGPFKDSRNKELSPSALSVIYVKDGVISELSDQEVSIEKHSVENETPKMHHNIDVNWEEKDGLKARVNNRNELKSKTNYQVQLNFELRIAP